MKNPEIENLMRLSVLELALLVTYYPVCYGVFCTYCTVKNVSLYKGTYVNMV
jgi:hypothetical protein